jgi:DNA helicase-2/ATP-dependent DNA helicase PcrA
MTFVQHVDETFVREMLKFSVVQIQNEDRWAKGSIPEAQPERWAALLAVLDTTQTPTIVYSNSRSSCDALAELLTEHLQVSCLAYHAGLPVEIRRDRERSFLKDPAGLMVATSAFGMGVDKADLRTVIHWKTPVSPEALYQEAGRAARSPAGRPAQAVLLFHESDLEDAYRLLRRQVPSAAEIRRLDIAVRELADHSGGPLVTVADTDLARLAQLRPEVQVRVALAQLQRAGLVKEQDRISGSRSFELLVPEIALSGLDSVIVGHLPRDGSPGVLMPTEIVDEVDGANPKLVWSTIRNLEHRGVIRAVEKMSVRLLMKQQTAADTVSSVHGIARAMARELDAHHRALGARRYLRWPCKGVGDRVAVTKAVELLAAFGYLDVRYAETGDRLPAVRLARDSDPNRVRSAFDASLLLIPHLSSEHIGVDLVERSDTLATPIAALRDAAVLLHICGVATVDPSSWQQGSTARRLFVCDIPGKDEAVEEAVEQLADRSRLQRLRLEALRRYAMIEESSEENVDVHQAYLEQYLIDPDFLENLSAATAADMLTGLTVAQQQAVTAPADRQLVIMAGPGTGKTRTVVQRIAYRVMAQKVLPENVLAVTFTRAATEEVRARLAQLAIRGVRVRTLHSVAVQLVKQNWSSLGFTDEPHIVDSDEQLAILRGLGRAKPRADAAAINLAKARMISPTDEVGQQYEDALDDKNSIDFGGCLALGSKILRSSLGLAQRESLEEIVVDEFQDLSPAQVDFVRAISGQPGIRRAHLTMIGDPRQAIYEWNGADPRTLIALRDSAASNSVELNQNFRSTSEILTLANGVIRQVLPRLAPVKTVSTIRGRVGRVGHGDERNMIADVVANVSAWQEAGLPGTEIAVLAFSGARLGSIGTALKAAGIVHQEVGLTRISTTDAYRVVSIAVAELDVADVPEDATPVEVFDIVDNRSGSRVERSDTESDDWARLRAAVEDAQAAGEQDLAACLRKIARDDEGPRSRSGVTVTTMHKAKGLEWQAVAVTDLGAKQFDGFAGEEERCRLLYVAVTRAKQHLHLSWTGNPTRWLPLSE